MSAIRPALLKPLLNLVANPACCIKPSPFSTLPTLSLRPATPLLLRYQYRPLMATPTNYANGKSAHEKSVVVAERVAHFERDGRLSSLIVESMVKRTCANHTM